MTRIVGHGEVKAFSPQILALGLSGEGDSPGVIRGPDEREERSGSTSVPLRQELTRSWERTATWGHWVEEARRKTLGLVLRLKCTCGITVCVAAVTESEDLVHDRGQCSQRPAKGGVAGHSQAGVVRVLQTSVASARRTQTKQPPDAEGGPAAGGTKTLPRSLLLQIEDVLMLEM